MGENRWSLQLFPSGHLLNSIEDDTGLEAGDCLMLDDSGKFSFLLGRRKMSDRVGVLPVTRNVKGLCFHACHRSRVLAYVVGNAKKNTQTLVLPLEHYPMPSLKPNPAELFWIHLHSGEDWKKSRSDKDNVSRHVSGVLRCWANRKSSTAYFQLTVFTASIASPGRRCRSEGLTRYFLGFDHLLVDAGDWMRK